MTKRRSQTAVLKLLLLGVVFVTLSSGCQSRPEVPIRKAIWVTRWDYKTEQDIVDLMENIDKAGFDTVLFQVRGNATVFYPSAMEPWAEEFQHQDPGFDPLEAACREARVRELNLHAWVNAVPGWRGITPPPATKPEQLWNSHPEWFLHSESGERQPLQPNYYVALNPSFPEVRDHVASVCEEILKWYPEVAGIHLDYIRFLEAGVETDYPRDSRSEELFTADTGWASPDDSREAWDDWRRDQVTEMVRVITERCRQERRDVLMTAAVYRTPRIAHDRVRQDWPNWLRRGYIDAVFPMQYDREVPRFESRVGECMDAARGYPVIMGLGTYLHEDPEVTLAQEKSALLQGCQGICHFAYSSFWSTDSEAPETSLQESRQNRLLPSGSR
ncbi:MAG: glycoside hydrolase family 10 protein [Planctomycetota bacterium]